MRLSISRSARLVATLLVAGFAFGACDSPTTPPLEASWDSTKTAWVGAYDSAYLRLNAGTGCAAYNNDDGTLSWAQSYLLRSLIDMYRGTGRTRYLDHFVVQADAVLAQNDLTRGLADYRGRIRSGWSATRYSTNRERVQWLVDDAVVIEPLLEFAVLVNEKNNLSGYRAAANRYVASSESAIAKFDSLFRAVPGNQTGHYLVEAGAPEVIASPTQPRPVPINWDIAAGSVHALLWQITGNPLHRDRALLIGRHFQNELEIKDNRYAWHYWAADGRLLHHSNWEDISHGAMEISFARHMMDAGLMFNASDMQRFGNTILSRATTDGFLPFLEMTLADRTSADPKCGRIWMRRYSDSAALWVDVGVPAVFAAVRPYLFTRLASDVGSDPQILAGLAQLVKWYDLLRP